MRYRELSPTGDYLFGAGGQNFLVDSPEMVAQSVLTRLRLWSGEWFLDVTEGTPWMTQILGENTKSLYDLAIQSRVLQTQGVTGIKDYSSSRSEERRVGKECRIGCRSSGCLHQ